ncbi:cytochrome P450 [Novosphingobium resinovorum]|uniref:Cytochrome n=1 Tax=Novosphingobium resinovorum TaxID=158500 RepID=A0A1D8AE77_9SPHN|nr:cytochrome P450 [Novosphingobium resinovorum]AOR80424.1 cytochrome [Novosphingobium resinovorum]
MMFAQQPIPGHVPAELVAPDFPFIFGLTTEQDPFDDLAMHVHEGPDIVYAPHAYPGGTAAWVPRRMAHLRAIYLDTEHFSSTDFSPFSKLIGGEWISSPAELDPPRHGPFRQMVNPAFTPRAMAALETRIRQYAVEYIDAFAARGECEFMGEFAFEFPIKVFMDLMGLPHDRVGEFMEWEMNLLHNHDLAKIAEATRNVIDYLSAEIEHRRANPRDDLITYGVQGQIVGRSLTQDELLGFMFNLFIGGLDTVSTNMGLHFRHLGRNMEDQALLRANPSDIPHAIDELMRAYGAVTTFRSCRKETELAGVRFMPGDKVAMSTTLAGRDPAEFDDPTAVRLDRKPRHVGFGFGIHTCVGMHLARRELRIAMEEFLARIPEFRIAPGHQVRCHLGMIQPVALPLVWDT